MRTPDHWSGRPGLIARLLSPLGLLYGAATASRMARPGRRAAIPVICVGNFTAGGAGKTPVVRMLAQALEERGEKPFVVSRGYGGRIAGPVRVDPARMRAADCGDEPLLLAREVPVIVARDRVAGAALAAAEGATLVVLDDGLQNPRLAKDFVLAVVDSGAGFGNGLCMPAGPLRAPVAAQIRHVDAVLVVNPATHRPHPEVLREARLRRAPQDEERGEVGQTLARSGKPLFAARIEPDPTAVAALHGKKLLAFAGIGRPQKFFGALTAAGLDVAATRAFADHHAFTEAEIAALRAEAAAKGLTLATTEKDAVRLPPGSDIATLPVRLIPDDGALVEAVAAAIARRRSAP